MPAGEDTIVCMPDMLHERFIALLRWSERYTKTDMVYFAESGFWMNLTTIILSLLAFLLYIVLGNVLSPETYGTYHYFISLAGLVTSLTLTGMNFAIMQAVPRGFDGTFQHAVATQLRFGVIALSGAMIGALYYIAHGNLEIAKALFIIGIFVPLVSALNSFGAYLVAKARFRDGFKYNMVLYVPLYGALALSAWLFADAMILLAVNLGLQVVLLYIIYRITVRQVPPDSPSDSDSIRFGTRLSAVNFLAAAAGQLDNILAFHFLGPAPLAIYSFATAIPDRLGGLFKFIYTAALPRFAVRPVEEIRSGMLDKVWRMALIGLIGAGLYALIAPLFFAIFFPQYEASVAFSQVYALTMLAYASNIFVSAIVSHRFLKEYAMFSIGTSIAQTAIQLGGILLFGLWGLVIAKVISNLFAGCVAGILFMFRRSSLE